MDNTDLSQWFTNEMISECNVMLIDQAIIVKIMILQLAKS